MTIWRSNRLTLNRPAVSEGFFFEIAVYRNDCMGGCMACVGRILIRLNVVYWNGSVTRIHSFSVLYYGGKFFC